MKHIKKEYEYNGQKLILETGLFANQATASVKASIGNGEYFTSVLGTIVVGRKKDVDWLPLQVVYEERYYASGKIKDSQFNKREGRPSDTAVLNGRLIDRSLRSALNENLRNDLQSVVTVLEIDKKNKPDILGVLALSTCLKMANIQSISGSGDVEYFWCYKKNEFIDSNDANSAFEKNSNSSFVLTENDYNDQKIILHYGQSKEKSKILKTKNDDVNISLCKKIIAAKNLVVSDFEFEKNNYIIEEKNIIQFNNEEIFPNYISSIRIGASKKSVFKSYITSLISKLENTNVKFADVKDILSVIIWHDLFNKEVKELINNKLISISKELGIKFHQLAEKIDKNPYQNINSIDIDPSLIDYIINPSYEELENSDLNLVISGNGTNITMIETGANFLTKEVVLKGIEVGTKELDKLCKIQEDFVKEYLK